MSDTRHATGGQGAVFALAATVAQLADILAAMSDDQYLRKPVGVFQSSVGGHVRHCLDHVSALLSGITTGVIDYEQRERGGEIETRRDAALSLARTLAKSVREIGGSADPRSAVVAVTMYDPGCAPMRTESSVGRELMFVLSHTVHHNAIIAGMLATLGVAMPTGFGYAPATIAHLRQTECAPSPS